MTRYLLLFLPFTPFCLSFRSLSSRALQPLRVTTSPGLLLKKETFVYHRRESIVGVGRFSPVLCLQRNTAAKKKHCAKCVTAAVRAVGTVSLSAFSPPFSVSLLLSVSVDCFNFFVPVSRSARFAYLPETRRRYSSHVLDPRGRRFTVSNKPSFSLFFFSSFFPSFTGLAFASEHRCCEREERISRFPNCPPLSYDAPRGL